ncbi:MAG TPA: glycine betaine ABC transporter substrate-binding protein, partial [Solirubrobacteraceae bacterium]|nr:glycine betaine ABC transporter substrate-binding protein [Solirubrobacteraceae bacterium]
LVSLVVAAPAQAQQPVRLAAPVDCLTNAGCGPGLRATYGLDVSGVHVPLEVADAGIQALDDGLAEVAVAFSSNPDVSRPDVLTLADDRSMIRSDHVVPVIRNAVLRAYGRRARDIRRRLNAASSVLTTLALRELNQQVIDGRLPEAVGGEFIDANGLGGIAPRRPGPRIVVGYQAFAENETLAHLYAEALRAGGYRVAVRSVRGLRAEAVRRLRRGRIAMYPAYAGSLMSFIGERPADDSRLRRRLSRALVRRARAVPLRLAPAQNRNVFVMKTDVARTLGVAKISDLAAYWPPSGS